jgi:lipid II:glycine glycyltransferase (peptidoglycan interpeptide bridge formation enzyme)
MFISELDGDLISVIFVARHGSLATCFLSASSPRKLPFTKAVQPLACAISWAKNAGLSTFDLGGIPVESDPDAKRASIAEFKRSFSRTEVTFVHEHARWLLP